jgi:hypothetical protein
MAKKRKPPAKKTSADDGQRGRPPRTAPTRKITLLMDAALADALDAEAQRLGRSRVALLETILAERYGMTPERRGN